MNEIFPKSRFMMKITKLQRITVDQINDEQKNDENEIKEGFKVISSEWINCNGKEFRESIYEDRKNKINRTIEIVNEAPVKFKINQIYMLPTRDRVWIYTEQN